MANQRKQRNAMLAETGNPSIHRHPSSINQPMNVCTYLLIYLLKKGTNDDAILSNPTRCSTDRLTNQPMPARIACHSHISIVCVVSCIQSMTTQYNTYNMNNTIQYNTRYITIHTYKQCMHAIGPALRWLPAEPETCSPPPTC